MQKVRSSLEDLGARCRKSGGSLEDLGARTIHLQRLFDSPLAHSPWARGHCAVCSVVVATPGPTPVIQSKERCSPVSPRQENVA